MVCQFITYLLCLCTRSLPAYRIAPNFRELTCSTLSWGGQKVSRKRDQFIAVPNSRRVDKLLSFGEKATGMYLVASNRKLSPVDYNIAQLPNHSARVGHHLISQQASYFNNGLKSHGNHGSYEVSVRYGCSACGAALGRFQVLPRGGLGRTRYTYHAGAGGDRNGISAYIFDIGHRYYLRCVKRTCSYLDAHYAVALRVDHQVLDCSNSLSVFEVDNR